MVRIMIAHHDQSDLQFSTNIINLCGEFFFLKVRFGRQVFQVVFDTFQQSESLVVLFADS